MASGKGTTSQSGPSGPPSVGQALRSGAALERAVLAVDVACFSLQDGKLDLLLVRRSDDPFAGAWALPGAAVGLDEPLDDAARRALVDRTGIGDAYLEQLYTFGEPGRDPRGRTVSVAYFAILPVRPEDLRTGRGVDAATWRPARDLLPLAFDHGRIAHYALWRLVQKMEHTPLGFHLLPEQFTLGDLRTLHETILDRRFDPSNFNRQALARWDLAPVPGQRDRRTRRPARLYRYIGARDVPGTPPDVSPVRSSK